MKRFAMLFAVLVLFACSQPVDVPKGLPPLTPEAAVVQPNVAPVASQPVVNVKPVGLQKPTHRLSKHAENQAEAAAYAKAYANAERANTLLGEHRYITEADAPLRTSGESEGIFMGLRVVSAYGSAYNAGFPASESAP